MLLPADADRWLEVWEHITENVSRWAIGAITIATDRGHDPGPHRLPARLELRRSRSA